MEIWKCGKLEAANKNHDFSFIRYSLKFMVLLVFIGFPNVFVLFFIGFENHVFFCFFVFLFLLAVPMFLSSWSWLFMVSIGFYNGFHPDHENHCKKQ